MGWFFPVLGFIVGATLLCRYLYFRTSADYAGKHVVITGASEGIGRSLAELLYLKGAKVTIMARTETKLKGAVQEITRKESEDGKGEIGYVCLDVTKAESVKPAMEQAEAERGPIDVLILGAGKAWPGYVLEQDESVFKQCMDLNYMGSVRCVKAVVPMMLKREKGGQQIVFIGSTCSVIGFIGYGSYAPSKFAVRGFADSIRNELKGTGISVHMAYPPDTDTPGFEEENKLKPKETTQISPPDAFSAEAVSAAILDGMSRGEYHIRGPDLVQNLLASTMTSTTPRSRWAPVDILLQPLLAIVLLIFGVYADSIAKKYGERVKKELSSRKQR